MKKSKEESIKKYFSQRYGIDPEKNFAQYEIFRAWWENFHSSMFKENTGKQKWRGIDDDDEVCYNGRIIKGARKGRRETKRPKRYKNSI